MYPKFCTKSIVNVYKKRSCFWNRNLNITKQCNWKTITKNQFSITQHKKLELVPFCRNEFPLYKTNSTTTTAAFSMSERESLLSGVDSRDKRRRHWSSLGRTKQEAMGTSEVRLSAAPSSPIVCRHPIASFANVSMNVAGASTHRRTRRCIGSLAGAEAYPTAA